MILVLGAGPIFATPPKGRLVITANGGTSHLKNLGIDGRNVIAVVTAGIFESDNDDAYLKSFLDTGPFGSMLVRESRSVTLENLRMCEQLQNFEVPSRFSTISENFELMTFEDRLQLMMSQAGGFWVTAQLIRSVFLELLLGIFTGIISGPKKTKAYLFSVMAKSRPMQISTGVLAVIVAIREARPHESIKVYGITADRLRYANGTSAVWPKYYLANGVVPHLSADIRFLKRVLSRSSTSINFDNPEFESLIR